MISLGSSQHGTSFQSLVQFSYLKICYKSTIIKAGWYQHRYRPTDQWKRIESLDERGDITYQWEKVNVLINGAEVFVFSIEKH